MGFNLTRYPSNEDPKPILVPREDVAWEARAVFNPSVIYDGGLFMMLYRTFPASLKESEPFLYRPGYRFSGMTSSIGYAESRDGIHFERRDEPFIAPDEPFDAYGCEDPRITKIGDTFYITYTAIDSPIFNGSGKKAGIRIALATTKDFKSLTKHGIIGPATTSKAAAIFPEKVDGGKVAMALTIASDSTQSHIAVRYFDSIGGLMKPSKKGWEEFLQNTDKDTLLPAYWWLNRGPELGAVPVKTDRGWLFIFSAESMSDTWTISAALSDLNEPHKLISRSRGYILQAVTEYERDGIAPNVTFPEGAVLKGDDLFIYYGCADTRIGLATCKLRDLLDSMEKV